MTKMRRTMMAVGMVAAAGAATPAAAQSVLDQLPSTTVGGFSRDRNQSVIERSAPDYSSLGQRLGAFRLDGSLEGDLTFTDNAQFSDVNTRSDGIYELKPSLSLSSQWSRNAIGAFASADIARYFDNHTENTNNWSIGALGRLDGGRDTTLSGNASYSELRESRASSSSPEQVKNPIEYSLARANASLAHTFNRLRVSGSVLIQDFNFSDGVSPAGLNVDQDYRDNLQTVLTARADYALTPDTSGFVEYAHSIFDYDSITSAGFDRSSDVDVILAGASFDLTHLVRGEIGVGYLLASHADATRGDTSGFSARAQIEYFPTQLTTVTFNASRDFRDTGIRASTGSVTTIVGARVDHELLRRLIVTARASYERDEYQDIDRDDEHDLLGVSATYELNRHLSAKLSYEYLSRDSSGVNRGRGFDENSITAGITYRY